ncbi:MAG: hypothetical protein ACODAU_12950, partial [Myxococcota bacterium]
DRGFADALDAAGAAEAAGARAADAVRELGAALRAGEIAPAEALDRLVQRALEAPEAQALSPVLRSELEAHLRRTLAQDPTLAALARDLERGR